MEKALKAVLYTLAEEKGFASVVPAFTLLLFCSAAVLEGQLSTWDPTGELQVEQMLSLSSSSPAGGAGGLPPLCLTPPVKGNQLELGTSTGNPKIP